MTTLKIYRRKALFILFVAAAIIFVASFISSGLSASSATGKVKFGVVNVRKNASTSTKVITTVSKNQNVTILKEIFNSKNSKAAKKVWYYVNVNGVKGYIRSDNITDVSYGKVNAVTTKKLVYRKGAGVRFKKLGTLKKGQTFTVLLAAKPLSSEKGGSAKWYKAKVGSTTCYVCSSGVKLTSPAVTYTTASALTSGNNSFEAQLSKEGFPESYKTKLRALHKAHPNWVFTAYKTNISWSYALGKQTKNGVSLVSKVFPKSYRSGSKQIEPGWYNASSKVVAYYMDPRNFLNEKSVYMFEDLSYKPAYQTKSVVSSVLAPSKLPSCGFTANIFVKAGSKNNTSPVFLAARARQENGNGGKAVNGSTSLGKVYNPFNIGAFGGTNPMYNGLLYAKAKGWNTPTKAVEGGAAALAKNYIKRGQYTGYYQRFNVRNGKGSVGTHQYMTNIMAASTEASMTKSSYKSYKLTDKPLVFEIPIYSSMPSSTKLP